MLTSDQHSSLSRKIANYVHKIFYNIGPGLNVIKLFSFVADDEAK